VSLSGFIVYDRTLRTRTNTFDRNSPDHSKTLDWIRFAQCVTSPFRIRRHVYNYRCFRSTGPTVTCLINSDLPPTSVYYSPVQERYNVPIATFSFQAGPSEILLLLLFTFDRSNRRKKLRYRPDTRVVRVDNHNNNNDFHFNADHRRYYNSKSQQYIYMLA